MAVPVSILILTQDEESNLPRCLEALMWCDDIVVLETWVGGKKAYDKAEHNE